MSSLSVSSDKDTKPCKPTSVSGVVLEYCSHGDEIPDHPRGRGPQALRLCSTGRKIAELYCGFV